MIPALVEAIKSQGLVLVMDRSGEGPVQVDKFGNPFPRLLEGIDGILKADGVLRFNESIDM